MEYNVKNVLTSKKISNKAIAALLGVSEKTLANKMTGQTDFTYPEACKIKRELCPEYDFEFLFSPVLAVSHALKATV